MSTNSGTESGVFVFALAIDQQTTREFAINLIEWSQRNEKKPLRVNINSQGGNILDGLYLLGEFNRLRGLGHHLTIAVYGRAASCAGWLLQAADVRIMDSQAWLLIHEVSSSVTGGRSAIKAELDRVDQLQRQTDGILTSRTANTVGAEEPLTVEMIHVNIDGGKDWWLDANGAKRRGLVDVIETAPAFQAVQAA